MKQIPKKPIFKKVGYQSGVIGVLTVPLHPKPIGKTWKLENMMKINVDVLNNW